MVGGYKRLTDGKFLPRTRISNSTFIDHPQHFNIANNVFVGHHNFIEASNGLTIEEGCQITNFISITTHSSHKSIRLYGPDYAGPEMIGYIKGEVLIGKYTFVGPHSTIMPNTKIGKGCLISAYSYVQGEFPDFSIIAGNPAKVVGDTREMDQKYLDEYPELMKSYKSWAD
jgi:acetyltransferase-like isoleucine patch superfamily enzyme